MELECLIEVNNKLHWFSSKNIPKHFQPRNPEKLKDKAVILLQFILVMVLRNDQKKNSISVSKTLISLINTIKGPLGLEVIITVSGLWYRTLFTDVL